MACYDTYVTCRYKSRPLLWCGTSFPSILKVKVTVRVSSLYRHVRVSPYHNSSSICATSNNHPPCMERKILVIVTTVRGIHRRDIVQNARQRRPYVEAVVVKGVGESLTYRIQHTIDQRITGRRRDSVLVLEGPEEILPFSSLLCGASRRQGA